jgi:hypothetical protein
VRRNDPPLVSPAPEPGLHLPALPSGCLTIRPTKLSPFKNKPSWAPGAVKNNDINSATLSTSICSGERKYGGPDDSRDDDELPPHWKILGTRPPHVTGSTGDSSGEVSNLPWPDRPWLLTHLRLQASSPPSPSTRPSPVHRILPSSRTLSSSSTQKESNGPHTPASPPHLVRPATSDEARYSDSTVSDGRDDSPSSQPAVGSLIEQVATPPTGRGPRVSETSKKWYGLWRGRFYRSPERHIWAIIKVDHVGPSITPLVRVSDSHQKTLPS